ncbi:MAG: nucleotidyltransferase family protein [Oscillospiraceae bacterium]|nr:nucleotidyltransferase family protein [Oscillospiraceae bacterium]
MTVEQQLILRVLGGSLCQQPPAEPPKTREFHWDRAVEESHAQAVAAIFLNGIAGFSEQLPEQEYQKLFKFARRYTAHNMRTEYLQQTLVKLLEQEQCPYVIIKGEAAAAYYPVPEHRLLGDVDFMVPEDRAEQIIERLKQQGYEHSCKEDEYHQILKKGTERMELHFEVAGIPQGNAGAAIRAYLADVFEQRRLVQGSAGDFYAPSHAHHGLIILLHMQHHMTSTGVGLRQLMDWACFVERTRQEPFWETQLLPLLKQIGLLYYSVVVTKMCSLYFGQECPHWACNADEELCRELMEDLLAGGNFGRKDQSRARSGSILPDWTGQEKKKSNTALLYHTLRCSVLKQRPELERKPVLLFGKMMGKVCRYLWLQCTGRRPDLKNVMKHLEERKSVYERLRMYEPE